MGLNIKNERVCELAREAARRSGSTQTGAIESALEAYLQDLEARDREKQRAQGEKMKAILAAFHDAPRSEQTVAEIMDELYDPVTGLPR